MLDKDEKPKTILNELEKLDLLAGKLLAWNGLGILIYTNLSCPDLST